MSREVIRIIAIDQPFCIHEWGDALQSPTPASGCSAQLGVDGVEKCRNTRATCAVPEDYNPGTLTLKIAPSQQGIEQYDPVISTGLSGAQTTPALINLGGMERSSSPLGSRESISITLQDHQHSDHLVDKYRLERETGEASLVHSGTAAGGSPASDNAESLELDSNASVVDDDYVGLQLALTGGAGAEQSRDVVDYDGATKIAIVSPRWATNDFQFSNSLSNAYWTKSATLTQDGDYWIIVDDNAASWETLSKQLVPVEGQRYIASCCVKKDDNNSRSVMLRIYFQIGAGVFFDAALNTSTGQVVGKASAAGSPTMAGAEDDGDDWRLWVVGVCPFGSPTPSAMQMQFYPAVGPTPVSATYLASQTGECRARNFQLERADALGEYIETTSAAIALPDDTTEFAVRESYKPYDRGTLWGKWQARNPYAAGYPLRDYQGYVGDALEDMRVAHYIIERIEGPNDGKVKIVAKDVFSMIEDRKAVAPKASRCELDGDISAAASSFTVTPADLVEEDYPLEDGSPSELAVRIGEEVIRCSRSGATFTVIERGAYGTEAAEHEEQDLVQRVLRYTAMAAHDIVYDLFVNYTAIGDSGSPAGSEFIDYAVWDSRASSINRAYTGVISEPTPVSDLVAELSQQAGITFWPDTSTGMINLTALRAGSADPTVDDDDIIEGTLRLKRMESKRISQVWVYYGQVNPVEDLEDPKNYRSRVVCVDADAEADTQYGTAAIEKIYSRWIPQFARSSALSCGNRILAMFRDPPIESQLELDSEMDGEFELAKYFTLQTSDVQTASGSQESSVMAVLQIERSESGIELKAQSLTFAEDDGVRIVNIEHDAFDINLKTIHDSQYGELTGGSPSEVVHFVIDAGVVVGATSATGYALRTGVWPDGIDLRLTIRGKIQGAGGDGGTGGTSHSGVTTDGSPGEDGGTALKAESPITIDNGDGEIAGGGGGGGGAGAVAYTPIASTPIAYSYGAPGGGSGAGLNPGSGGAGGGASGGGVNFIGQTGNTASETDGASGGFVYQTDDGQGLTGVGGTGGDPGQPGTAGGNATNGVHEGDPSHGSSSNGGAGGAAGDAVEGDSFITWTAIGEIKGAVN
jgi:hypothetical protein